MDDAALLKCAVKFCVSVGGVPVEVTRYNNHGRLIADGCWVVARDYGSGPGGGVTNVHYLGADGLWRYKNGSRFTSAREALDMLEQAGVDGIA